MKNAIVVLFMFLSLGMNAQIMFNEDGANFTTVSVGKKVLKHLTDNHILSVKAYQYSKKYPKGIVRYDCKYDVHGNTIANTYYNKRGRVQSEFMYQYNDSNKMTAWIGVNKKGKPKWGMLWFYDKSGNNIEFRDWWKDTGKTTFNCSITYNAENNPIETKTYYRKKLNNIFSYEYYDDGSKKKTTSFNRKGKIIGIWNYDCNPIGKLQESKMKDTSKICVHYETDKNGNAIKVTEEYTQTGWPFTHRLRIIGKYDKDNNCIELIKTKMNGKETWHSSADIDAQGNQTEWRQYVPNSTTIKKRQVYTYNSSGDVTEITIYSKPSDKGTVLKYVYN